MRFSPTLWGLCCCCTLTAKLRVARGHDLTLYMCDSLSASAGGHGLRFRTVPNKATESDGKQALITLACLQIACDTVYSSLLYNVDIVARCGFPSRWHGAKPRTPILVIFDITSQALEHSGLGFDTKLWQIGAASNNHQCSLTRRCCCCCCCCCCCWLLVVGCGWALLVVVGCCCCCWWLLLLLLSVVVLLLPWEAWPRGRLAVGRVAGMATWPRAAGRA